MDYSEMQHLSELPNYLMPSVGEDGTWCSAGGIALRESIAHGSTSGVMGLLNSMEVQGMAVALREAGFTVDAVDIQHGRSAVFESVRQELIEALELQVNGFDLPAAREKSHQNLDPVAQPFAAKAIGNGEEADFSGIDFQGDVAAARAVQAVMSAMSVSVELLGDAMASERSALVLVAGQGLKKGIQGFGFDGTAGKYQVPLSMADIVDLHRDAAEAVAIESTRTGLAAWAAGDTVKQLSDWVPDSVQRLLHGSLSLVAAEAVVQAIQGGAIARHAGEIGAHEATGLLAAQGFDVNAPTVRETAEQLGLTVKEPNRLRGQYHGTVIAVDHRAGLVKFARADALELPFSALKPGQAKPEMGDSLRVGFKAGEMTVTAVGRSSRERSAR